MSLIRSIVIVGFYILLGVVGVLGLIGGQPLAWIQVGISALGLALRGFLIWARRRQERLIAEHQVRRAEPGYVAPIVTPQEAARLRQLRILMIPLASTGPFVAVAIAAIIARPFLPSYLQTTAVVIAMVMFAGAIVLALTLWKALKRAAPPDTSPRV